MPTVELRVPVPWCLTCHQGDTWVVGAVTTSEMPLLAGPSDAQFSRDRARRATLPRVLRYELRCGHTVDAREYELVVTPTDGLRPMVRWVPR